MSWQSRVSPVASTSSPDLGDGGAPFRLHVNNVREFVPPALALLAPAPPSPPDGRIAAPQGVTPPLPFSATLGAQSHSRGQVHGTDDEHASEPTMEARPESSGDELATCNGSIPNGTGAATAPKRGLDERHWLWELLHRFLSEPKHGEPPDTCCSFPWQKGTSSLCPLPRGPSSACQRGMPHSAVLRHPSPS